MKENTHLQLAAKLKAIKEERRISLEAIADELGVNRSTVKRWIDGSTQKIKPKYVHDLERILNLPPGYLFDSEEVYINLNYDYYKYDEIGHPFYGNVHGKISAGAPLLIAEDADYPENEKKSYIYDDEFFWLQIKGDSMNIDYKDGTYVLVHRQSYAEYGDCVAARINENEATVKYFKRVGDIVYLFPHSTNPHFEPQVYNLAEDSIEIMGVIKEGRTLAKKMYF